MSTATYIHSHSGLERLLNFPKHTVLVDKRFEPVFIDTPHKAFTYGGIEYIQVNTLTFVERHGVFKNFSL